MLTYSINQGTVTESTNVGNINLALGELPDNTSQLISPKDARDAILTNWANIVFKPTSISASNIEYIGIDSSPAGIALKEKIFLGKRNVSGSDVMNIDLLNSDTDIFIYNTKSDQFSQESTKISLLSGTNQSLYIVSPYLESLYSVGMTSSYIDLNIVNQTGSINLISENQNVTINGLIFPTATEISQASNGYVLKYSNIGGEYFLNLEPVGSINIDTIYSSGTVSITGSPVLINGNKLELTNSSPVPVTIGGIVAGSTFNNDPIVSVLNTLFYPYVPPTVSMYLNVPTGVSSSVYVEYNSITQLSYNYNIVKKSLPITAILSNPGGDNFPTPSRLVGSSNISSPISSTIYSLVVTDGTQSVTATASLQYIYPCFYSVSANSIDFSQAGVLSSLNKLTFPKQDINVSLVGDNSYVYFLYPSYYGNLTAIVDSITGWNFLSSFTKIYSGAPLTNISPSWSTTYNIYSYTSGYGKTTVNSVWTFKF